MAVDRATVTAVLKQHRKEIRRRKAWREVLTYLDRPLLRAEAARLESLALAYGFDVVWNRRLLCQTEDESNWTTHRMKGDRHD